MKLMMVAIAFILYLWAVFALGLGPMDMLNVFLERFGDGAIFAMAIYMILLIYVSMMVMKKLVQTIWP